MAELEKENCRLCGQEIYEPLLSEYREKKERDERRVNRLEEIMELIEVFLGDHSAMNTEDWDNILLEAQKKS